MRSVSEPNQVGGIIARGGEACQAGKGFDIRFIKALVVTRAVKRFRWPAKREENR